MSKSVVVRKEFILSDNELIDIYEYFDAFDISAKLPSFTHVEGDFKWEIDFEPYDEGIIKLHCTLYKDCSPTPIYSNVYNIQDDIEIYNVFMQDTKCKYDNVLVANPMENAEIYFTFKGESVGEKTIDSIRNEMLVNINKPLTNILALFNYFTFDDNNLFTVLYNFIYNLDIVDGILNIPVKSEERDYVLDKLDYLTDKLSYYGYGEDYLDDYDEIAKDNMDDFIVSKKILNNKEILQYFIVITLDYLLYDNKELIIPHRQLKKLAEIYLDNCFTKTSLV